MSLMSVVLNQASVAFAHPAGTANCLSVLAAATFVVARSGNARLADILPDCALTMYIITELSKNSLTEAFDHILVFAMCCCCLPVLLYCYLLCLNSVCPDQ